MLKRFSFPFVSLTFALFCSVSFAAETFRVATYNVENYLRSESLTLPRPIHAQTFFISVRQPDVRVVLFGFLCRRNLSRRHLQRRKLSRPANRIAQVREVH